MQYEQDYIMRLIKQVIRALIGILLNKQTTLHYELPINRLQTNGDDILQKIVLLADKGSICEAENILIDEMESGAESSIHTGLLFYDHINNYDDEFLEKHNFSRDEMAEGIRYAHAHGVKVFVTANILAHNSDLSRLDGEPNDTDIERVEKYRKSREILSPKFQSKRFSDLTAEELYEILKSRNEIFVIEQDCIFQDCDDRDYGYHVFCLVHTHNCLTIKIIGVYKYRPRFVVVLPFF